MDQVESLLTRVGYPLQPLQCVRHTFSISLQSNHQWPFQNTVETGLCVCQRRSGLLGHYFTKFEPSVILCRLP